MAEANKSQDTAGDRKVESGPWYTKFPAPVSTTGKISATDLLGSIKAAKEGEKPTYVLVDVRRNDHEGGTIATSINLPAQSIYYSLDTLRQLFAATDSVRSVIFYCGSSSGRGPRCAAWFQDCLNQNGVKAMQAYVLEGGIKGWVRQGRQPGHETMLELIKGYESKYWDQFMDE